MGILLNLTRLIREKRMVGSGRTVAILFQRTLNVKHLISVRNNVSLSNRGGLWNQVTDSFSVKGFGRGGNQNGGNRRMTQPMGTIDESTLGSDMHGGNPYYRQ